jgi:hypothetical protein
MATNDYVYTRFICTALRQILLARAKNSSPRERILIILRSSIAITERDLPDEVREDWRNMHSILSNIKLHDVAPNQARRVLDSFWNITRAVIAKQASNAVTDALLCRGSYPASS